MNRYAAQKQYWTEQKRCQLGEVYDEEMVNKLRVAAEKEKEQNELEYRKMLGNIIQYGSAIQVGIFLEFLGFRNVFKRFSTFNLAQPGRLRTFGFVPYHRPTTKNVFFGFLFNSM